MDRTELRDAWQRRHVIRLTWALKDADSEIRGMAAYYLGKLKGVEAGPALVECLVDSSEGVRMSALRALARIGDRRAIPAVARTAATDPVLAVSTRAIDVLAQLGDPRGTAGFVSLLTDTDRHLANRRDSSHSATRRGLQTFAARRLVELRARDAAPVVRAAAPRASSFRERVLLRRTAWRLRHPPRLIENLKGYLWWWALLLGVFTLAATITGDASSASTVMHYFGFAVIGLVVLFALGSRLRR